MARRQGNAIFNRIARLHISVLATCRDVNLAFGLLLPSYLLVSVLMSLLSTVSIILADGTPDFFALSCFSYLFIFFVPMCLAGQRLEDTGECVAQGTYRSVFKRLGVKGEAPREDVAGGAEPAEAGPAMGVVHQPQHEAETAEVAGGAGGA
ncbi:uncharacterized protein LOC127749404 [Frankliniella occidentalis]|uniref:Uncharacterized protein LOC127749404 n=1 Tax=Frankliniella occidentalis TaxID=133901 RepID=A0A9C6WXU1_FRAOC|nr:uncharacterized protein LOC127749404 [Frankliniella occidentalis]